MASWYVGITDKGKRRVNNEDTFIVQELPGTRLLLACVIDGVGGYNGGEVAAEITRKVILEKLKQLSGNIVDALKQAVIAANQCIQQQKHTDKVNAGMACVLTCVIADKKSNRLWYAHVGDTRLYLLRDDNLVKISSDHSAVGFLEESGRLSELEAMQHPRRNEIDKALGFEAVIADADDYIETGESPFLPGDRILLCSDGLTDMISSSEITTILNTGNPIADKARALVEAANRAGGNDNITAVIVENMNQSRKLQAGKPRIPKNVSATADELNKPGIKPVSASVNNGKRGLLICLFLFMLGLVIVAFIQRRHAKPEIAAEVSALPNDTMQLFVKAAGDSTKYYAFVAGTSVKMRQPVYINKDSFYIKGNGLHLAADTNYKGPAIIVSNTARQIVLDSIVFENFDAALFMQKNNVVFRNVRFINCKAPVQYKVVFANGPVSGHFNDSIFFYAKSLKK